MYWLRNFKLVLFLIFGVLGISSKLTAQVSKMNNIILLDVFTINNPKNCNEVVSDKLLLTTHKRCFEEVRKLIGRKPDEEFMVIYLLDNAEGHSHFYRVFRSTQSKFINDSLNDYRQISTYEKLDFSDRAVNMLVQLSDWGVNLRELDFANIHYFSGCDSFVAKNIEFDYINRIIRLAGLIDKTTLQLFPTHKFELHYNGGNNQYKRKNELYEYFTTSF